MIENKTVANGHRISTPPAVKEPTIMVVSNDINLRQWIKTNFGEQCRIAVCTEMLDFTAELKWDDFVKLILIDYADEQFDTWEVIEILETTHPSLPCVLLTQSEQATDEIMRRAPHKKIISLYQPLELVRGYIDEILRKSLPGGKADGDQIVAAELGGELNVTFEIERLQQNLRKGENLSKILESHARQSGFEGTKNLRRYNEHLENIQREWSHLR